MSGEPRFDYQPILDTVIHWITERPKTIVLLFLIVTLLFALGLPSIELEPGGDAFTEGTDEQQALEAVQDEFEPGEEHTTQLIQRGENVLSRDGILRMLRLEKRVASNPELRVAETSSVAQAVAFAIAPQAESPDERIRAVEAATEAEVTQAVRQVVEEAPEVTRSLSDDFNSESAEASATIATVEHEIPSDGTEEFARIQSQMATFSDSVGGDIIVFGPAILEDEFEQAMADSLTIMVPVVIVLVLLFLLAAYRDPLDLLLGLVALVMAVIWTFGFLGHAGIAFNTVMIAIPPLLLAVGIDFGIHAVNRYREERIEGQGIHEGMTVAQNQLLVAFFIATGTTAIGFGANMTSDLGPIFEFGFVAALGIMFTFLIFGIFMPAAKVLLDDLREGTRFPDFGQQPLGSPDSALGKLMTTGAKVARRAPALMLVVLLLATVWMGYVGMGVQTEFDQEEFLPYEDPPTHIEAIPEPLAPGEYEVREIVGFLNNNFESGEDDEVTIYVEAPLHEESVLEEIHRIEDDPPAAVVEADNRAVSENIIDVIHAYAEEDDEFAALVDASDINGNGVPERNLAEIYDRLLASSYEEEALLYLNEDYQSTRIIYTVETQASQEQVAASARGMADRPRLEATATGETIVAHRVTELLFDSAIRSLIAALALTAIFLMFIYDLLEGRASLALANLVPIITTVAFLAGTMAILEIPFNAITAMLLSITIGIGVDYSVHLTHRFVDEYDATGRAYPALETALQGTGGGITGSMITTAGGVGATIFAVIPMMAEFGILMALGVVYSYLAALVVLPPALLLWERGFGDHLEAPVHERILARVRSGAD